MMQFHEDDRAQRSLDIFPQVNGQINVSHIRIPGHVVAWHAHTKQTDYWYCIQGSFKVGLSYLDKVTSRHVVQWEYLSDKQPQRVLAIPPEVWHGYMALEPNSILLYYLTHKYNPDDEFKCKPGDFNESWKIKEK